jgi:diguanylate cyclase (GGDEF)-like protein/PAS domain S-box-containing protein
MPEDRDLATIYDAMACGVIVRDAAGLVVFANAAALRIFGRPPEQLAGSEAPTGEERRIREDGTLMPDDEVPNVAAQLRGEPIRNVMMGMVRADGYVRWLLVDAVPVKGADGSVSEVVSSFTDVTDRKKAEQELERQTLHDQLTGLPNRILLLDRLEQAIRASRRLSTPLALLVMDLDRFRQVNDSLGHEAGDALLRETAERVPDELRDTDTFARLGADEFAIVLPGSDQDGAERVARKVVAALQRPFEVAGGAIEVSSSIGIALWPRHGEDGQTLLRRAEIAMYSAKHTAEGFTVYAEEAADEEGSNQLALMAELRHGLSHDEVTVMYQPIITMESHAVTRVESLARWRHRERGLVPPAEFIPLAERSGLVRSLFEQVLVTTLRQCQTWQKLGLPLQGAVNLSMRNLLDPELVPTVSAAIERTGGRPELVGLEITESMLMADPPRAMRAVEGLRALGVQLAIDDFGVGYSSLAYLQRLPVYAVKIDRSFVSRMTRDRSSESIVKLIIDLGHTLGMKVVAEGIEDRATWDALAELRCDAAQGFYIAKPMVAKAIPTWLAEGHETTTIN